MIEYRLFTDMTADISEELLSRCGEISFLPMPVRIGEVEYMYGLDSDMSVRHFYDMQRNRALHIYIFFQKEGEEKL